VKLKSSPPIPKIKTLSFKMEEAHRRSDGIKKQAMISSHFLNAKTL
jgi:hypothetical protein